MFNTDITGSFNQENKADHPSTALPELPQRNVHLAPTNQSVYPRVDIPRSDSPPITVIGPVWVGNEEEERKLREFNRTAPLIHIDDIDDEKVEKAARMWLDEYTVNGRFMNRQERAFRDEIVVEERKREERQREEERRKYEEEEEEFRRLEAESNARLEKRRKELEATWKEWDEKIERAEQEIEEIAAELSRKKKITEENNRRADRYRNKLTILQETYNLLKAQESGNK